MKRIAGPFECSPQKDVEPKQNDLLNSMLPPEVLELIFSYLLDKDVQAASLVSRFWEPRTIAVVRNHISIINKFSDLIINNFEKHTLDVKNPDMEKITFPEIFKLKNKYRIDISQFLNRLKSDDLNRLISLEHSNPEIRSHFSYHALNLAKIYSDINVLHQTNLAASKSAVNKNILTGLAKAMAGRDRIPSVSMYPTRQRELKAFIFNGEYKKAIEHFFQKMDAKERNPLVNDLFDTLMDEGDVENALYFADWILYPAARSYAFLKLTKEFLRRGQTEKALKTADMIPNKEEKASAYSMISMKKGGL